MKNKVNWELIVLALVFISSLKVIIWKSIDPSTFSKGEQEKIGLNKVHNIVEYK